MNLPAPVVDQLTLPVNLRAEATFSNFYAPPGSPGDLVVSSLKVLLDQPLGQVVYLWGGQGAGCRHLLQAACRELLRADRGSVQYLPLEEMSDLAPSPLLEDLEQLTLVCLSRIQTIAGIGDWELALFDLYNRILDAGSSLLLTADRPPGSLPLQLPDLKSRLTAAAVYHLPPPDDNDKMAILQFRAAGLGLQLGDDAARYLINRAPRSMESLMACLQRLDQASLQQRRKLTVPFIRQLFGW